MMDMTNTPLNPPSMGDLFPSFGGVRGRLFPLQRGAGGCKKIIINQNNHKNHSSDKKKLYLCILKLKSR